MIFTKINKENIKILYPFLYQNHYRLCDYSPLVLLLWRNYLDYRYCIEGDTLFLSQSEKGVTSFLLPITEDMYNALILLKEHCKKNRLPFRLVALPESMTKTVKQITGLNAIDMGASNIDYAYDINSLSTLKGRRYSGKRNHINRFTRDFPDAQFVKLTAKDKHLVIDFLEQYHKDSISDAYSYYKDAVDKFASCFDEFDFLSGAIKMEGKLIAICFGDIVKDTLYVNIEMALRSYSGIYEKINHEFINKYHHQNLLYVNREEDMGDLGLRKAKLSYHPFLWRKYAIIES